MTLRALDRLARTVSGGAPEELRDQQALVRLQTGTADKVIVIDPGHGGNDPGRSLETVTEQSVIDDICSRLEGRLSALGVQVLLTRPLGVNHLSPSTEVQRAQFANRVGADIVISLHCDWEPSGRGSGRPRTTTAAPVPPPWWAGGSPNSCRSTSWERTGLRDCRTHAKTWDLLRPPGCPPCAWKPATCPTPTTGKDCPKHTSVRRSPKASLQPCTTSSPRSSNTPTGRGRFGVAVQRAELVRCSPPGRGFGQIRSLNDVLRPKSRPPGAELGR